MLGCVGQFPFLSNSAIGSKFIYWQQALPKAQLPLLTMSLVMALQAVGYSNKLLKFEALPSQYRQLHAHCLLESLCITWQGGKNDVFV